MAVDIVIQETIDVVDITVNPNIIEVNVTRTSGGGGSQTLAQTLVLDNQTGGENILVNNADAIELENTSLLQKGTYNFGGNGGISRICSNNYEDMWQNGFRHVFDQSGFIRNSTNCFDIIPDSSFDVTLRFGVGSFWTLDNGTTYVCTDNTEGAAVWEIYISNVPNLTQVLNRGDRSTVVCNGDYQFFGSDIATFLINEAGTGTPIFTIDGDNDNDFITNCVLKFQSYLQPSQLVAINGTIIYAKGEPVNVTNFNIGDLCELKKVAEKVWWLNVSNTSNDPIPTKTSDLINDGANGVNPFITALDIPTTGQASTLVREVKNMTGATLTKGTVVFISGANGNKALVSKAIATTDALSARTFGLLQSNISNNGTGNCVIIGDLSGLNTSSFAEGAQLYLSGVTAGTYTDTRTLAPTHLVYVGKVTRSHPTQGQIEVQIQNGYELEEIHDCQIISPTNNQALIYETSTDLWKNKTIIEDTIANGVTDKAPSQNAVFDALALKQDIITAGTTSQYYRGDKTFQTLDKSSVGLGNVDNTSDANKPVSTAQATALALKQDSLGYTPVKTVVKDTAVSSSVTGTTTETILKTYTIAGGTFAANDVINLVSARFTKSGTVINLSTFKMYINTTNSLSGAVQIAQLQATGAYYKFSRTFALRGGSLLGISFTANGTQAGSDIGNSTIAQSSATLNTANTFYIIFTGTNAISTDSILASEIYITN